MAGEQSLRRLSVTVQLPRADPARNYLDKYFGAMKVRVYWGNASDFMRELRERWEASTWPRGRGRPYVGPRPFDRAERGRFYGRDQEARALVSLVVAHRVVLLYAASGAGKTSLLNAGLVPLLEEEDGFEVLPAACGCRASSAGRRWQPVPDQPARATSHATPAPTPTADATLAGVPRRPAAPDAGGRRCRAPRLLVIDQFEELFTLYPEHWPRRARGLRRSCARRSSRTRCCASCSRSGRTSSPSSIRTRR